ncbi:MAG: AIDA repeat-containing protein, partial [Lentisphaeria bacterium]|nr:AIDA repeat-containing protein [Lentisphaeria bacterium]
MEQQIIANGGLQYVPQIAVQYVYLDFDGESTSYNGEILTVDNVEVKNSSLTEERIADITAELNALYADQNVIFVTERPTSAGYSTIFISKTSAFDQYGNFAGLAETIDKGNQNSTDKAFVMLNAANSNAEIVSTIAHETDHLLGTLDHGGSGLVAYAAEYFYNQTYTGILNSKLSLQYHSENYSSYGGGDTKYYYYDKAVNVTINSGGSMIISRGCTANDTTVNSGGYMHIFSGGVATQIIENGGDVNVRAGANVEFASNTISGLVLSNASMTVHKNTIAHNTTINSWGYMYIYSGGVANSTTVNSGSMNISSGGVANSTTVNSGGYVHIYGDGVANSTTVNSGGRVNIRGGAANSTTVNSGCMYIYDGVANSTTVNSGGVMYIFAGGKAHSTMINSGGRMTVCISRLNGVIFIGDGVANSTIVNSGGWMCISSGGVATQIIENGGYVDVDSDAQASFVGNTFCGLNLSGSATVHSGTTALDTVIDSGYIKICSGGIASKTTVNSGGHISLSRGGMHAGTLNIASGGVVSAYSGSIISIDLTDRSEASPAVINDIKRISGSPTYTVNVDSDFDKGTYKLAGNAANFKSDVVFTVDGSEVGMFKWTNGMYNNIQIGNDYYTLVLDQENNLCLKTLPCISIDYSIDEIDQIVYYHGEREDEFDGVVMKVPYSATATITLDKDTPDGQYEFVTVLDGIDKAEQKFSIQVLDGMPIYLSSNACYYGTQISETAENSTWTIKVNDFVLTEEIQKTMTVTPKYGSLLGSGLLLAVGAVFLTGCSGDDVELLYDGKNSDANKDGYYLECCPQYKNTNGNPVCVIRLIPNIREKTQRIDVQLLDETTGKVDKITAEMNLIQYDYADMSQDLKITIPANSLNRDYGLEFTVNKAKGIFGTLYKLNSDGSKVVISDICESQNIEFHVAEDQTMHCWAAVAANMLCDAGYLGSVSAQACFEYWSKAYYRRNGNISKMTYVKRVFNDLGINDINDIYETHKDVASGLEHLENNPTNIGCIGLEGKHGVTCYAVDLKRKKITITDSDQYLTRNTRRVCDLVKKGNEWYIRNYSNGTDWKITGVESIIPKTSNNLTYDYTSITPSEITEKVSAQNAVGVLNMDAITVINGSIEEAIVTADGILEIADGATGDTIILHNKAALNLKSGATVRGEIMTHGGTISTESGVLFEEAEINFVISMLDGKKEAILDDLGNVGNMPLNVTVMAHQSNGEYILADGADGFNGEITIHGEYGNSNQLKMGFEVGELGTLKAGEKLKIGDQVYSLDVENNQLIFRVSSAPLAVWNVFADITYLTES